MPEPNGGTDVICLSREQWQAELSRTDPFLNIPLMEFSELCNRVDADCRNKYPGVNFSNRRYVAHLEDVLERGGTVPAAYLRTIDPDEFRFDAFCFPKLKAAMGQKGRHEN